MFEIGQLTRLPLGYVGESGTRTISIDMKAWLDEYPGALIMVQVIRPVDHYKYPAAYTKTDGVIHWTVDGSEVMYAGKGLAQIALYNPDTKQEYKSRVVGTVVAESLDGFNDILLEETDPASKWVNQVLEAAESAEASKNDAANSKEEAAAAIAIVATQKNEALIAIQNEGAAQVVSVNDAGTRQAQFVEAKGEEVLGMIPEDYTELSKNVATLTVGIARDTAPPIIPTATGVVVTIPDSANRPLAGLRLYGMTTQDGTPTPNSPVPLVNVGAGGSIWVKVQGKNLLNYDAWKTVGLQRGTAVWENNGVTMTATGDDCYTNDGLFIDDYPAKIPVVPGESITLSWEADRSYSAHIFIFPNGTTDGAVACNNTENRPLVYTATEGVSYVTIRFSAEKAGDVISYRNIMVERGYPTTAFEPYEDGGSLTASTPNGLPGIPVSSGGNYTDSTGQQWICDEVDFGRGVYVQRVKQFSLSQVDSWAKWGEHWYNHNYLQDSAATYSSILGVCSHVERLYNYINAAYMPHSDIVNGRGVGIQISNAASSWGFTGNTPEEFKAFIDAKDIKLVYACLPIETPLSTSELAAYRAMTSQKPTTTVYNDAGAGLGIDYIADTKNYIDQRIAALLNA